MLLHQEKLAENKVDFCKKVMVIASRFSMHPDWLMSCMYQESRFNHRYENSLTGSTGLLQFTRASLRALGSSRKKALKMSNVGQLDLVSEYLNNFMPQIESYADLCMAVAYPEALGKPGSFLLGNEKPERAFGKGLSSFSAITLNFYQFPKTSDTHRYISKAEMESWFMNSLPDDVLACLNSPGGTCKIASARMAS